MLQQYLYHLKDENVVLVRNSLGPENKDLWKETKTYFMKFPDYPAGMSTLISRLKMAGKVSICTLKLFKILHKEKPDIIFANGFYGLIPLYFLKKIKSFKLIFMIHTSDTPLGGGALRLIKNCDLLTACCEDVFKKFEALPLPKQVIYNAVPNRELIENKANDTFTVTFIGRMVANKNPMNLLLAVQSLAKEQDIQLQYIGEGPENESLQSYIDNKEIGDKVKLLGFKEDIYEHLTNSDLLVLPSELEAFPLVILEAFACGVPVLASNVGGIPEVVIDSKTGYLLESNSAKDICKGIREIQLQSTADWAGNIAKFTRKGFSFENQRKALLNALDRVL